MRLAPRHDEQRQQNDQQYPSDPAALLVGMETEGEHGCNSVAAVAGLAAAQDLQFGKPE